MAILNSDGSASDTQTQINASSNGDTVLLPSSGSFTWSAGVDLPSTKYITLDLNGRTITLSGASGTLSINSTSSGSDVNRITNGSIVRGSGYNQFNGPFGIGDTRLGLGLRVDHITFTGSNVLINGNGQGIGLIDHCSFPSIQAAQETMHWYGMSGGTGWTTDTGDTLAGSASIFTIEDCTFSGAQGNSSCCFQGYYGARIRARYNTISGAMLEVHGTTGSEGARWWEFYANAVTDMVMCIRAGSGVVYGNTGDCTIAMQEEDSGYPADYQVGRGINQTLDPARYWSNDAGIDVVLNANTICASGIANMVQLNRDVYNSARPSYVEYTYPHPLQGAGGGGSPGTGGHGRGHKRGILRRM